MAARALIAPVACQSCLALTAAPVGCAALYMAISPGLGHLLVILLLDSERLLAWAPKMVIVCFGFEPKNSGIRLCLCFKEVKLLDGLWKHA